MKEAYGKNHHSASLFRVFWAGDLGDGLSENQYHYTHFRRKPRTWERKSKARDEAEIESEQGGGEPSEVVKDGESVYNMRDGGNEGSDVC